jgi:hypothetical protein
MDLIDVRSETDVKRYGNLPSGTSAPAQTNDKISANSILPVHGIGSRTLVVREVAKVAVVVLDVVNTTLTLHQSRFGDRGGKCCGQEACQRYGDLHVK